MDYFYITLIKFEIKHILYKFRYLNFSLFIVLDLALLAPKRLDMITFKSFYLAGFIYNKTKLNSLRMIYLIAISC